MGEEKRRGRERHASAMTAGAFVAAAMHARVRSALE